MTGTSPRRDSVAALAIEPRDNRRPTEAPIVVAPPTSPSSTVASPAPPGPSPPPPTGSLVPGACGQPAQPAAVLDRTTLEQQLVGTWLLCGAQSLFDSTAGEAGMQVNGDGTWVRLGRTLDGGLIPLPGPDNAGTWSIPLAPGLPGASSLQVSFVSSATGLGVRTETPMLTMGPYQRVRFVGSGTTSDYLRTTAAVRPAPHTS